MTDNNTCIPFGYIKSNKQYMNKNDIISKIYFDPSGYSSIQNTLKEVKQIDKTVKLDDVKEWF